MILPAITARFLQPQLFLKLDRTHGDDLTKMTVQGRYAHVGNIGKINRSPDRGAVQTLCDSFIEGAEAAGNMTKSSVHNQTIGSSEACYAC